MKAKKLIEVAMPIKEISSESVRDKSIRHGHLSTLHLWWARRPLPACRAVVFGSLVPDPLDANCPDAFRDAVKALLCIPYDGIDWYRPYDDIPYTAAIDHMDDHLRNRLMMFIGKFSDKCQQDMISGKATNPKEQLSNASLIKWENRNNSRILRIARELIWVAYNSERHPDATYLSLHESFNNAFDAIKKAEVHLYSIKDRHLPSEDVSIAEQQLQQAIADFQKNMPSVLDPFAGGAAIPLEAARLGCRSFGNDINPVAHIIEKGTAEFPQRYGKPIVISEAEFEKCYGAEGTKMANETERNIIHDNQGYHIPNRLAWDVEYHVRKILSKAEQKVGWMYPADEQGHRPIAFYWARTATCSNPSCKAHVPMLKSFNIVNTNSKKISLEPHINGTNISFQIKHSHSRKEGWFKTGGLTCPCCGNTTPTSEIKQQAKDGLEETLIAIITESANGKQYSLPYTTIETPSIDGLEPLVGQMTEQPDLVSGRGWHINKWSQLFSDRQLYMLTAFVDCIKENQAELGNSDYANVIKTYIAIWFDRIVLINTSFGRLHTTGEKIEHPFSRQAIAFVSDYPELNPFCTYSGSASNQLDWVLRYIESESKNPFASCFANASSGEKSQFAKKEITSTVTDPPYYDAIAYGDISDFFYVWMKRTLGDIYPINFATPQTPKTEECTALKHHHGGSMEAAKRHFETKLTQIFDAIEEQTSDIVSIMFAHQSTEAWSTLCNSILDARMNITGSWPIDTELANRSLGLAGAALESSVTVACRPSERQGYGEYRTVKRNIEQKVATEVEELYRLGFRGADLLTACFGQAVSEFGQYQSVEKADGSTVMVIEMLELARESAFNTLLQGIKADDETRFYIGWLQMNGMGETDYDDATKFTRVGVNVEITDIFRQQLLVRTEGNRQHLASAAEHMNGRGGFVGTQPNDKLIDQVHRAMILYQSEERHSLLKLIHDLASDAQAPFWRVLASLKELLPTGNDLALVQGLLQNGENLRHDSQKINNKGGEQISIF